MGIIVSLKTVFSLQIIDYQGSCPEAGRGIIVLLKQCSACKLLIIRVLALRLAQGFSCLMKKQCSACKLLIVKVLAMRLAKRLSCPLKQCSACKV